MVAVFAIPSLFAYLGIHVFARTIGNQRTCRWADVDNIKTQTHINIPKTKGSECKFIKEQNANMAFFDINKDKVNIGEYINQNKFKALETDSLVVFELFLGMDSIVNQDVFTDLYYSKGENWQALLNKSTGRLWITID